MEEIIEVAASRHYQYDDKIIIGNPPVNSRIAHSVEEWEEYLTGTNTKQIMGSDTEASRLDTRKARLAGISVALSPYDSMYAPVGHKVGINLPLRPVIDALDRKIKEGYLPLYWNAKYDKNTQQSECLRVFGVPWEPEPFLDLMELVYLDDPDRKDKQLKVVAKQDLDYDMAKFESLFTPAELKSKILDISTKDPEDCKAYAGADSISLMRLYPKYEYVRTEFEMAVKVDTKLVDIIRRVEHNGGMILNESYIDEQMAILEAKETALRDQIHRRVGVTFEINSPKQLGIALFETAGIPHQGMTRGKNPQYSTDAETLEKLAPVFPLVEDVICYRKVVKARSTYFNKLKHLQQLKVPIRFSFHTYSAPTFRFSAPGGDPDFDGFTGVNIQAISNGESRDLLAVELREATTEEKYVEKIAKEDILVDAEMPFMPEVGEGSGLSTFSLEAARAKPWVMPRVQTKLEEKDGVHPYVCIRDVCAGCDVGCQYGGIDLTRRLTKNVKMIPSVRQVFMAPPEFVLLEMDYSKQEICIGANISGEQSWIKALLNDEDMHAQAAADAYNMPLDVFNQLPAAEREAKRNDGKVLNFASFYGATGYTIARKINVPTAIGEQIFERFKNGKPQLFAWMDKVKLHARKNKFTTTYFGRRRWLKDMYRDMNNRQMVAFGDRSAVNTCIQGTGAEVTRIAMVKVDKNLKDAGLTRKEVFLTMMVHDSLMYAIRREYFNQVVPLVSSGMMFNVKSWPVQLTVDGKYGRVWGMLKKFKGPIDDGILATV